MAQDDEPVGLDGVAIVLVATLAGRLGIEARVGRFVRLRRDRPGAANAGRKVMALICAMLLCFGPTVLMTANCARAARAPAVGRLAARSVDARDVLVSVHVGACAPARHGCLAKRSRARGERALALAHFPSGQFAANSAGTVIASLAHNLTRWTVVIGLPGHTIRAARTLRRRLLQILGRLTRTAGQWTLHLAAHWPWQDDSWLSI